MATLSPGARRRARLPQAGGQARLVASLRVARAAALRAARRRTHSGRPHTHRARAIQGDPHASPLPLTLTPYPYPLPLPLSLSLSLSPSLSLSLRPPLTRHATVKGGNAIPEAHRAERRCLDVFRDRVEHDVSNTVPGPATSPRPRPNPNPNPNPNPSLGPRPTPNPNPKQVPGKGNMREDIVRASQEYAELVTPTLTLTLTLTTDPDPDH